jgi:excisionase family DNA binding protein
MDESAVMAMLCSIRDEVAELRKYVQTAPASSKEILDINECSTFLGLSTSTIYKMTASRSLPFYKSAKKIWFKRPELIEWATRNRHKTMDEIEEEMNK